MQIGFVKKGFNDPFIKLAVFDNKRQTCLAITLVELSQDKTEVEILKIKVGRWHYAKKYFLEEISNYLVEQIGDVLYDPKEVFV